MDTQDTGAAPAADETAADPAPQGIYGFLEQHLGDEALKVAHDLQGDLPALIEQLGGAAVEDAPALLKQVLAHPFMQHLEAQLPTALLGVAHGILGLAL